MLLIVICFLQGGYTQSKGDFEIPRYYGEVVDYSIESSVYKLKSSSIKTFNTPDTKNDISHFENIKISNGLWSQKQKGIPNMLNLNIEFKGEQYGLLLRRRFIRSSNYELTTSSPNQKQDIDSYFYYGVIEGDYNSWATLAVVDGQYKILMASKNGNIEVAHQQNNIYKVYNSHDLMNVPSYKCHTNDSNATQAKHIETETKSVGSDCVELYIECDNQSYVDNGNSVASTEAWALSIMNDVATIYNTINVPMLVNGVFVWNSVDPYVTESSVQAVRDSFVNQIEDNYSGRVAQLFSTRDLGGGLAYGIGGLCGSYPDFPGPYSIATSLETNYSAFPNFSFTVNVVAHELGHVFGARHTHACVWGAGFDSQIDDCGNVYAASNNDQPEGQECFDENNPILPSSGGTIMSFCNLTSGGIDLSSGFGTEVGDYIYDKYITAPCATGVACATIPPSNDECINAIELQANGICNTNIFDNVLATASGLADPSCGTVGSAIDVWFTFTALDTEYSFGFRPVSNQVEDVVISIYSGACGALTEIACETQVNDKLDIELTGLTVNQTYYIRVIEEGSDEFGNFELCLVNETLPCHPAIGPLVDLYNSTNGPNWTNNNGWTSSVSSSSCLPCQWYGITCDNQDNIIGIDLYNNNLNGTVPTSLAQLTKLRMLKLMNNNLSGTFPDIWNGLDMMEFVDLSNNQFTGTMPTSLGNLMKLNTLYIENNNMSGGLLASIADLPLLNVYWTKNNNFSGCYPGAYTSLCEIASVKFTNNPLLPNGGNAFVDFCAQGIGGDIDNDGFCFGQNVGEDCVDDDDAIYPMAPELCDGKDNDCNGDYDEGLSSDNTWVNMGSGNWENASNWSLGIVPEGCHDVILPASAISRTILVGASTEAFARSITIFSNNTLDNNGILNVSGSDSYGLEMHPGGTYENSGAMAIENVTTYGIITEGTIENSGTIEIENLGMDFEVYIYSGASFLNNGTIRLK